ncbi:MAG: rhomboid family intramembrane serine protease [Synergistaceae bacterium]|nr:rhomboid family intramembrane serine protease [Synergistaceae bacterium]
MTKKKFFSAISINSPVILGFFFVSAVILALNYLTMGMTNRWLSCYKTGWSDPLQYLRLFTHVLVHMDYSHFVGNFLLILVVGPMVEEKYGFKNTVLMFLFTAAVTGGIHLVISRNMLMGASGVVFALILIASFTNIREGKLPLTVLLVGLLYIGSEVVRCLYSSDNISHISHIAGGICGAGFGLLHHGDKFRKRQ